MVTEVRPIMDAEKFAQGDTWESFMAKIKSNVEQFQRNYDTFTVSPDDAAWFRAFKERKGGDLKMVVIGCDWCPDVVRGLPPAVRLCEAAGIDLRIFIKEEFPELMDQFLWRHEYQSVPVIIFYTGDFKELGHWIERPAIAYKQMAELADELKGLPEDERLKVSRARRTEWQDLWKQEEIRELKEQVLYRVM